MSTSNWELAGADFVLFLSILGQFLRWLVLIEKSENRWKAYLSTMPIFLVIALYFYIVNLNFIFWLGLIVEAIFFGGTYAYSKRRALIYPNEQETSEALRRMEAILGGRGQKFFLYEYTEAGEPLRSTAYYWDYPDKNSKILVGVWYLPYAGHLKEAGRWWLPALTKGAVRLLKSRKSKSDVYLFLYPHAFFRKEGFFFVDGVHIGIGQDALRKLDVYLTLLYRNIKRINTVEEERSTPLRVLFSLLDDKWRVEEKVTYENFVIDAVLIRRGDVFMLFRNMPKEPSLGDLARWFQATVIVWSEGKDFNILKDEGNFLVLSGPPEAIANWLEKRTSSNTTLC